MTEPGRYLIVRLEPGLHISRHVGIGHVIMQTPGVECIFGTDLSWLGLTRSQMSVLTGPEHLPVQAELFGEVA